jgi:hypothetical protein
MRNLTNALIIVVLTAVTGCSPLSKSHPESIDLTGIWKLNPAMSDDTKDIVAKLSQRRPANARSVEPRQESKEAPGVESQEESREARRVTGETRGTSVMEDGASLFNRGLDVLTAKELDIEQRLESTRIDYDQKELVVYHWGREKRGFAVTESGWQGNDFVIRTEMGRDANITRSLSLSDDRQMLTLVTETDDFTFTLRYDYDAKTTREVYPYRDAQ